MEIPLGAKDPKHEINLGKFGSVVFLLVITIIMAFFSFYIIPRYVLGEGEMVYYVQCADGTVEQVQDNVTVYCSDLIGSSDPTDIQDFLDAKKLRLEQEGKPHFNVGGILEYDATD